MTDQLAITQIIIYDPAFRLRDLDPATVNRYAEDVDRLPPVEIWQDPESGSIYLVDGRHRLEAHRMIGIETIGVFYFTGSRAEAEARVRAANLTHALPLTTAQRRQARIEILERLYEYSNNWLAEDYMACSPNTVAALREFLEDAGQIPVVDRFRSKDGSMQPRRHERREMEEVVEESQPDEPDRGIPGPDPGGGYDDLESDEDDEPEGELPTEGGLFESSTQAAGFDSDGRSGSGDLPDGRSRNAAVKLAQLGEPLAVEVMLYIDGEAYSIPATMLIAEGAIGGVDAAAPGFDNVLVLKQELAQELNLCL